MTEQPAEKSRCASDPSPSVQSRIVIELRGRRFGQHALIRLWEENAEGVSKVIEMN